MSGDIIYAMDPNCDLCGCQAYAHRVVGNSPVPYGRCCMLVWTRNEQQPHICKCPGYVPKERDDNATANST